MAGENDVITTTNWPMLRFPKISGIISIKKDVVYILLIDLSFGIFDICHNLFMSYLVTDCFHCVQDDVGKTPLLKTGKKSYYLL